MKVIETFLKGCFVIEPEVYNDTRGLFFESFSKKIFKEKTGLEIDFVQDNISISKYGVIRGLHIQKEPFGQSKLIKVVTGKILDVVVDIRKDSSTFGNHFSIELSAENNKQLFIPKGFLHGFSSLANNTIVSYKCDSYYNSSSEDGVIYNDTQLNINWKLKKEEIILSGKDKLLLPFNRLNKNLSI